MAEDQKPDQIEDHVALTHSDGFAQATSGETVTGKVLLADGGDGKEKEATLRSHHAGASSDAPANSGIPSAEKQHGVNDEGYEPHQETQMGKRDIPIKQNVEP